MTRAIAVLIALIFSKYFYLASITSYYIFYLMHHFACRRRRRRSACSSFLRAAAAGTVVGGPIGDRIRPQEGHLGLDPGRPAVHPGAALCRPAGDGWPQRVIGLVLSSAFPAIVVYAQELMPGRVGMVSGLFFGFAFGMGGIGAAVLGEPRRPDEHRVRLPGLLVPAADRVVHGTSPKPWRR